MRPTTQRKLYKEGSIIEFKTDYFGNALWSKAKVLLDHGRVLSVEVLQGSMKGNITMIDPEQIIDKEIKPLL